MDLEEILKKYEKKEMDLLFEEIQDVMSLLSDNELLKIYQKHSELFAEISNHPKASKKQLKEALVLFVDFLRHRQLSKDEFDVMTVDDVLEYIKKLLGTDHSDLLYNIVKVVENDTRI